MPGRKQPAEAVVTDPARIPPRLAKAAESWKNQAGVKKRVAAGEVAKFPAPFARLPAAGLLSKTAGQGPAERAQVPAEAFGSVPPLLRLVASACRRMGKIPRRLLFPYRKMDKT